MHNVAVLKHPSLHLYIISIFCNAHLMCSESVCFLVISVNQEKADGEQRELCETRALLEASEKFLLWCWKLPERPLRKGCTRDCCNGSFYTCFFFFFFISWLVGKTPATQTTAIFGPTSKLLVLRPPSLALKRQRAQKELFILNRKATAGR